MIDTYAKSDNRKRYRKTLNNLYNSLANSYIDEIMVRDAFLAYWKDRKEFIQNSAKFVLESSEEY